MNSAFNKTLMVVVLCLIFVGQSMASSIMFYSMVDMNNMTSQNHNMTSQNHQNMNMMEQDSGHNSGSSSEHAQAFADSGNNDSSTDDCCAKECLCFASGCSSITAFAKINTNELILDLSTKIHYDNSSIPNSTIKSLFRPPIHS